MYRSGNTRLREANQAYTKARIQSALQPSCGPCNQAYVPAENQTTEGKHVLITQESLLDTLEMLHEQMSKELAFLEDRAHSIRTRLTALGGVIAQAKRSEFEDDMDLLVAFGKDRELRGVFMPLDFESDEPQDKGYRLREAVTAVLHNYDGNDAILSRVRELHMNGVLLQEDDLAIAANTLYRLQRMDEAEHDTTGTTSTRKVPAKRQGSRS